MLIEMAASPTLTGRGEVHRDRRPVREFLAPRRFGTVVRGVISAARLGSK